MTQEAQKLINELPKHYYQCDKCDGEGSIKLGIAWYDTCDVCGGNGTIVDKCVFTSDVIKLVEELTKWNKVEDGLPESSINVLLKRRQPFSIYELSGFQLKGIFYSNETGNIISDVIEWKYIF